MKIKAGENKVVLKVDDFRDTSVNVDYLQVRTNHSEAEKAKIEWEPTHEAVIIKKNDKVTDIKKQGNFQKFTMNLNQHQKIPIFPLYKSNGEETERSIFENGKKAGVVTFASTSGDSWSKVQEPSYLYNGTNKIPVYSP